jgi:uncharacterized membrane protein YgcG
VHLAAGLLSRLTGKVDAVSGASGEAHPASVRRTADGFSFNATGLGPGENLTLAIGFRAGTFTPRDSGFFAAPWPPLALLGAVVSMVLLAGALVVRVTRLQDAPGAGLLIPEYLPPKGVDPLLASVIVRRTGKATAAQILDLAVAGNVRVLEERTGKRGYRLEFRTADGADSHELEFLHALFGNTLTRSEQRRLDRTDARAVKRIADLMKRVRKDAVDAGYRRQVPAAVVGWLFAGAVVAAVVTIIFAAVSLGQAYGSWWPALLLALAIAAAAVTGILLFRVPLTVRGVRLRDYLRGLEQYIALAEADRLRYLQSPQGAQRVPVSTDDRSQLVKLNERLLPYAVLFDQEKKWAEEVGRGYEELGAQPSWYVGSGPFNAALFASSVGAVATSAASAYSATSGGSGGGATSGGGGGGGGGAASSRASGNLRSLRSSCVRWRNGRGCASKHSPTGLEASIRPVSGAVRVPDRRRGGKPHRPFRLICCRSRAPLGSPAR